MKQVTLKSSLYCIQKIVSSDQAISGTVNETFGNFPPIPCCRF